MGRHTDDERPTGRPRPAPDRRRGPTRSFSGRAARFAHRAAATDRRERFRRRREEVEEVRRSRRRGRILTSVAVWGSTVVCLVGGGWLIHGMRGAAVGGGAVVLLALGVVLARWLAARRGAVAWDWTIQRHRLLGNPFEQAREPTDHGGGPDLDLFDR